jgi:type II secretory pathway predicted ATPase ExeA
MYRAHWGLRESPFRSSPCARYFYESPVHDEALSRLHYLIENRRRVGLLVGPRGSGKTLLFDVFRQQMRKQGAEVAEVCAIGARERDLLWSLAESLRLSPRDDAETFSLWRMLSDCIVELRYQQRPVALLVDDADRAGDDVRRLCLRLAQIDPSPSAMVTLILSVADERRLGRSLLELCDLRIDLDPWEADDTAGYLNACVAHAGRAEPIFDLAATQRIHMLAQGIPRRVSQLAELALLAGAGKRLESVDEETVESAYRELFAGA